MKKFLSVISLLLVAAMLMATPMYVSATEPATASQRTAALDYALDPANGVTIIKAPATATSTPVADGVVGETEYAKSYVVTDEVLATTSRGHDTLAASYTSAITGADLKKLYADAELGLSMEELVKDGQLTYYVSQDNDYIYFALQYDAGVIYFADETQADGIARDENGVKRAKGIVSRDDFSIRLGFNMNDPDDCIYMNHNSLQSGISTVTFVYGGRKTTLSDLGITVSYKTVATEKGYIAHEKTYTALAGKIVEAGTDITANAWTHYVPHTVIEEFKIDKATLLSFLNAHSSEDYDQLPNAFFARFGIAGQFSCDLATANRLGCRYGTWASEGGGGFYSYSGTRTTAAGAAITSSAIFPNLIVFSDSEGDAVSATDVVSAQIAGLAPNYISENTSVRKFSVGGYTTPTIDGVVNSNEGYTLIASMTSPALSLNDAMANSSYTTYEPDRAPIAKRAEQMDFYMAHDEGYIYLAWYELGGYKDYNNDGSITYDEMMARNNYNIRIGLNMNDPTAWFMTSESSGSNLYIPANFTESRADGSNVTTIKSGASYISTSVGKKWLVTDDITTTDARSGISSNFVFNEALRNQSKGYAEIKISKQSLIDYSNTYYGTNYTEFPDAFYIAFATKSYYTKSNAVDYWSTDEETMWLGAPGTHEDTPEKYGWVPEIVVLHDKDEGPHNYEYELADAKYFKTALTCTQDLVYYKSCICGAVDKSESAATFTVARSVGHVSDNTLHFEADADDAYKAATTQHYKLCTADVCVEEGKKIEFADHVYNEKVIDEKYLVTARDCDSYAVYYMSCVCGAYAETADTFEDEDDGYRPHIAVLNITDASEHWYDCQYEDCNAILDAEGNVAAKVRHTYDQTDDTTHPVGVRYCLTGSEFYKTCVCGRASTEDVDAETEGYVAAKFTQGEAPGHIWSEWVSNHPTDHWKVCTSETCDDIYHGKFVEPTFTAAQGGPGYYGVHNYVATDDLTKTEKAADATCTVPDLYYKVCECGAISATETFEVGDALGHDYETTLTYDVDGHWYACSRGENCSDQADAKNATASAYAAHAWDQQVATDDYLASSMTCTDAAVFFKSCVCGVSSEGYEDEATFVPGTVPGHTYNAEEYEYDENEHWNVCTSDICDEENRANVTSHVYDQQVIDEKYVKFAGDCKIEKEYYMSCLCGAFSNADNAGTFKTEIVLTNHVWGDTPVSQNNFHFYQCIKCSATDTMEACTFANGSTKCAVCGGAAVTVAPAPSNPGTVVPEETTPVETQPAETQPAETQPAETQPAETQPAETQPAETTPAETTPAETEPAVTEPAETEPAATEPAETEPADEAGCAGAISIMGLALVATLGACGVVATKKKDEE